MPYNCILNITKYFTIMHHQILLNSWPSWPPKSWWHHFWTTPGLIWPLFSIYDDDLSFWSKHTQYSLIAIQKICTSRFFLDKSLGLIWIFQHSRPNSRINQHRHPHSSDSSDSLFHSWSDYEGTIIINSWISVFTWNTAFWLVGVGVASIVEWWWHLFLAKFADHFVFICWANHF